MDSVSIVQKKTDLVLEDVTEEEAKMEVKEQSKETQQRSTKKVSLSHKLRFISSSYFFIKDAMHGASFNNQHLPIYTIRGKHPHFLFLFFMCSCFVQKKQANILQIVQDEKVL